MNSQLGEFLSSLRKVISDSAEAQRKKKGFIEGEVIEQPNSLGTKPKRGLDNQSVSVDESKHLESKGDSDDL